MLPDQLTNKAAITPIQYYEAIRHQYEQLDAIDHERIEAINRSYLDSPLSSKYIELADSHPSFVPLVDMPHADEPFYSFWTYFAAAWVVVTCIGIALMVTYGGSR